MKQNVAELYANGTRLNGFVYADGRLIATQADGIVYWQHTDASGKSKRTTQVNVDYFGRDEVDPSDVKVDDPNHPHYSGGSGGGGHAAGGGMAHAASLLDLGTCDVEGMVVPCAMVENLQEHVSSGWDESWESVPAEQPTQPAQPEIVDSPMPHIDPPPGTTPPGTDPVLAAEAGAPIPESQKQTKPPKPGSKTKKEKKPKPGQVELNEAQSAGYAQMRRSARFYLLSNACKLFLASKFAFGDIRNALEWQKPYNGLLSSISLKDAGLVGSRATDTRAVLELFTGRNSGNQAATARHSEATRYDVYLNVNSYGSTTLIHEAIHSANRNLSDADIAGRLTGVDYNTALRRPVASSTISRVLAEHGCGYNRIGE